MDFIEHIVAELKQKRLSKTDAVALIGQFSRRSSKPAVPLAIHPLLHRNTSDLSEHRYESTFTGEEFFLADHRVTTNGQPSQRLLPGVAYLEMARAAIYDTWPKEAEGPVLELSNTIWPHPFAVTEKREIRLELSKNEQGQIGYEIYSEETAGRIVHCQGCAVWRDPGGAGSLDVEQLKKEMGAGHIEPDALYAALAQIGIVHGRSFKGIIALHRGARQALAQLRLPEAIDGTWEDYVLHPGLMDSALQAAAGLVEEESEPGKQTRLPFALESMRIISPCKREMFAWVRYAPGCQADDEIVKVDIDLCDERGSISVELRGLSTRFAKSEEDLATSSLNSNLHLPRGIQPGLHSFVPVWNQIRPETLPESSLPLSTRVLLLGGDPSQLEWVQKSYPNAYRLPLSESSTIDSIAAGLKECEVRHLLWIAPDVTGGDVRSSGDDQIIEQQEAGVVTVFRIVKALLALGYGDKELSWTMITSQTCCPQKDERIKPTHAGVWGLAGSLKKEYPHWTLNVVDVDSLESVAAQQCLVLIGDKRDGDVACRQGEWFQQEFVHVASMPQGQPLHYRQQGVYVVIGGAGGLGESWTRFMMEHYQARVVWIGRRKPDATIEEKIQSLTHLGPAPLYIQADARDLGELERARRMILEIYPAIHGVVHSAIVLQDQSLARMEESAFRASLSAKVDTCVNMDRVFGQQQLDFMLFFSSISAFIRSAGQANYSAGCTFKDSFVQKLQQERVYPVKVMNWGYWGSVGIVADESHSQAMRQLGIGSIEPDEAMAFLQRFVSSELRQAALIKIIDAQSLVRFSESLTYYPKTALNEPWPANADGIQSKHCAVLDQGTQAKERDALLAEILASSLASLGLFRPGVHRIADLPLEKRPAPFYDRWLSCSTRYLQEQNLLGEDFKISEAVRELPDLWLEWEAKKSIWALNPNLPVPTALLEACLKGLPGILKGQQLATEVIFPGSSMHLVEGIYGGNAVADYFNEALRETLASYLTNRRSTEQEPKIRILEVGAGTGATTAKLLPLMQGGTIEEYCYTDISKAFLMHAEELYQQQCPAITTAVFDASKPLSLQEIAADHYDVVIATNVLHATPRIRETLRNVKATLKNQGVLLLNEISTWSLLSHLTFGLLEGWWLAEDTALRLPGSPGLASKQWREILVEEGFESIFFPADVAHQCGQQIIVARSNGWVRQPVNPQPGAVAGHKPAAPIVAVPSTPMEEAFDAAQSLREKAVSYFKKLVASSLKMRPDQIDPRRPLSEYGLDSIVVGQLTYQLRKVFGSVTGTLFFEVQSIAGLAEYFLENKKAELITALSMSDSSTGQRVRPAPADARTAVRTELREQRIDGKSTATVVVPGGTQRKQPRLSESPSAAAAAGKVMDVAIIGLSGRYPQARNLKEFWNNLSQGVNCITEIPKDRWDWERFYDPEKGKPGKMYTRWGGFLEGIDRFDPLFFKISPVEAKRMDPQERIFLESCYHAIEDAGYTAGNLGKPEKTGVFVGVMNGRYTPEPNHSSIANRVSYLLNFQGPSLAVDTACSSSLTALHMALESLYLGESECAIVGGVNLIIDPDHYLLLTEMTMLSSGHQCKAFGEQADGMVDAEGVGAVVLKPLAQAEQDGDHIYGVIKGSAINAGGRTNGYTVPNPKAQSQVVAQAMQRAKVSAEDISYIEAHGTGTALGDPIEIAGLTRAFNETSDQKQFCALGSLKSNIGHCESAAGIAGLTKVLLQMKHQQLVPSLHADIPNREIDFAETPFKVQKKLEAWRRPVREVNGVKEEGLRMAGLSSFGAGGSNAHLVLQEYPAPVLSNQRAGLSVGNTIIVLSARSEEQLKQKASDLLAFIREEQQWLESAGKTIDLEAMGYTLQVGREAMGERLGMVVNSVEQVAEKLKAYVGGEQEIADFYRGQVKRNDEALWLFSSDDDLQQTVDKWVARQKYSKLLELWVRGVEVDWSKLYGDRKPQRMSLPVYPFARERYWIEGSAGRRVTAGVEKTGWPRTAVLHPLLHCNTSDLSEQRYCSTFTGQEFFLNDHQVAANGHGKQKVLPGVAYLEMARAAVEDAWPRPSATSILELRNVVWAQPVVVEESQKVSIALTPGEGNSIDYEIYSQEGEEPRVHGQGQAVWSEGAEKTRLDVEQLKGGMGQGRLEADRVYAAYAEMGLIYGAGMQAITGIDRGNRQALAYLRLPGEIEEREPGNYVMHPAMVDGALQGAFGLMAEGSELSSSRGLPFALEEMRILAPWRREMIAWVRYAAGSEAADKVVKLDVDLCDASGNVCLQMRGFSLRELKQERAAAVGGEARGRLLAVPVWETKQEATPPGESEVEYREHHVVLCEMEETVVAELRTRLPNCQWLGLSATGEKNIAQRYSEYALACFERIRSIQRVWPGGKVLMQIVVAEQHEQMLFAGLSGLLKTARLENPQLMGQLIRIQPEMKMEELARRLREERRRSVVEPEVRYATGQRQVLRWKEVEGEAEPRPILLRDDGVYLITGGMGGLGMVFAREILEQTRAGKVILIGRSALSREGQARLEGLCRQADRVSYRQVDVRDEQQVRELVVAIQQEWGGLQGIIHSAGQIADNFIVKKSSAEFGEVLGPKVTGSYNLDQASRDVDLDFMVLFSSMTGAVGNVGQSDYAAGNGFLDQLAAYRNQQVAAKQRHGRTRSINWGLWQAGGMNLNAASRELLHQTTGMLPMDTDTGTAAFYRSLALPYDQILAMEGALPQLRRVLFAGPGLTAKLATKPRVSPDITSESLIEKTQYYLCQQFSELLQLPPHRIDPQAPLETYGIDSILAMKMTNQLEKSFGSLSKTLFFEYQTIAGLAAYFVKAHPASVLEQVCLPHACSKSREVNQTPLAKSRPAQLARRKNRLFDSRKINQKDIAIVGLAGRYPQADTLWEFWRNLEKGRDCITEIPAERWDNKLYYDPVSNRPGKSYCKWGGFLADVDKFDPLFFNISPREAELMDPQERLFLEVAWETIEDAGYTKEGIAGGRVGVFVGVMWGQYEIFGAESTLRGNPAIASSSYGSIANRVSYFFDFHGPSLALDTMCSSSLTAIHLACEALRGGDIDAAIAGGVNLTLHPYKYLSLSQGKFAASDGKCRSFGEGGDGYVPGEGVGAILLKPLEHALRDGDQVYAVIRSSALNHGGKTNGYTVPNPNAQADLIIDALKKADIDPSTLSYIETHGTGTSLGDPIEITGLTKAFDGFTEEKQFCPIGSVKSNIGHLESAAGIAAVTKAVLQLRHKQLVPSLHAAPLNPNINFKDSPFYVQTDLTDWKSTGTHPRRAGVSSFGAGGSNAHLILEEQTDLRKADEAPDTLLREIFVLSAKNQEALVRYAGKVVKFLEDTTDLSLSDVAYTCQVGRTAMPARLAIVTTSLSDLRNKLNQWLALSHHENNPTPSNMLELQDIFSGNKAQAQYDAANLIQGQAGKAFLENLVENGDVDRIAKLWVLGVGINWLGIPRRSCPKKISLPTYPFAKERCWILEETSSLHEVQKRTLDPEKTGVEQAEGKQRNCYFSEWTPKEIAAGQNNQTGPILIFDTSEELLQAMKLQAGGASGNDSIVLVRPGDSFQEIRPDSYVINPERPEQFQELLETLKNKALLPRMTLHHCSEPCNLDLKQQVAEQLNNGLYTLSYFCKALMKERVQGPVRFMSVFASNAEATAPLGAALAGFFKTLTLEHPRYLTKVVDIQGALGSDQETCTTAKARLIWNEFCNSDWTANEIRYQSRREEGNEGHARYVKQLALQALCDKNLSSLQLQQNGVYLITGGLGGLGLIFAEYLAKNFKAKLVLVGRSIPNATVEQNLKQLQSYGAEILFVRADVSELKDMERAVAEAKARFSTVNGVFHCAGVNRDAFILKKTKEEITAVLAPKVYGAINVDLATSAENLDLFIVFSSIAGVLGNLGQSDYAYANHFLDDFAEHRDNLKRTGMRQGRTLSIAWPLWDEGGMRVSQDDVALLEERTGISPLPTHEGIRYWEDFLQSERLQGVALYGAPSKIAAYIAQKPLTSDRSVSVSRENIDGAKFFARTEEYLKALIGEETKLAPDRIGSLDRLESFGLDSLMINRINLVLEKDLGALPKTLLYEHETVRDLALFLTHEVPAELMVSLGFTGSAVEPAIQFGEAEKATNQAELPADERRNPAEPIAIIGIHGRFPHSADLEEYWENLKQGRDLIDLVPASRWDCEDLYHPDPVAAADGKIYCKWGGFLDDFDKFDPHFFNISKEEAKAMDPQERLFLESVWAAIEDAGYTRDSLKQRAPKGRSADVGVFVGVTTNSYLLWGPEERSRGNIVCPSAMPWSIANRVSYFFDLNGPSMPVDTACSSSLVAVHLACASLRNRECQIAIAGGVNLYLHPSKYQSLCKGGMLSVDGKCHSYGAGGDGFVPGEGVGTLLLKPLSKAIEHKDRIYAVIPTSAFDHSGRSNGYSAPNPNSQASLISQTLYQAHIDPETLGYVEGHGTGTQLGDSLEIAALTQAFRTQTAKKQFCSLGSVKANIGHSESAAGVAGLAKIILQLKHGQLAPSIYSDEPNPNIEFEKTPFYLQRKLSEWKSSPAHPRRALINSFGAGGVNACLVLEEYALPQCNDSPAAGPYLFVLSAKNEDRLREYSNHLLTRLRREPDVDLASVCHTLQVGREAMEERLAIVASDLNELIHRLDDWSRQVASPNIYRGSLGPLRGSRRSTKIAQPTAGRQSLGDLAAIWVTGEEVAWDSLHSSNQGRRMSLPTYPFARERYWISDSLAPQIWLATNPQLHPLISCNSSTLKETRFSSSLVDSAFYALDHTINDEGVFPAAGFLEIACMAGSIAGERKVRTMKDMVWVQPLRFARAPKMLTTSLQPLEDGATYVISSRDDENETVLHAEGRLAFGNGWLDSREAEDGFDIEALKARCVSRETGAAYYERFKTRGIHYGPSFRTIQEIFVHPSFALSRLKIPDELKGQFAQFVLHPSIIDGALQTVAGLVAGAGTATPQLPFSLDQLDIRHSLRQICYAYAELVDSREQRQADFKKFNIRLLNESGDVLINFKNLFLRPINTARASSRFKGAAALASEVTTTLDAQSAVLAIG